MIMACRPITDNQEKWTSQKKTLNPFFGKEHIYSSKSGGAVEAAGETIEEFEAAEEALKDESVSTAVHRQLARLGGSNFRELATGVMKAIMTPTMQRLYSLHGKKGKKAFLTTRLCKVATGDLDLGSNQVEHGDSEVEHGDSEVELCNSQGELVTPTMDLTAASGTNTVL
ncbi:hypothetical protein HPB52_005493 [Rhipicephalus sanguineus]|uniref:Uncharacterized protein n=1 Tax=Rhipicephalus sanguineus TaxID=34632 RepID=A0A9D4SVX9_RHISA|nr:hypothetical protein HPB52_005493 [Rhipicephalus sanguineus]